MSKFYSAQTGGFYCREIHGEDVPADAVAITDELHAELLAGQANGGLIVTGANGMPALQPSPLHTWVDGKWVIDPAKQAQAKRTAMDAAVAAGMAEANKRIAVLQDAVDLEMATPEEEAALKEWKKYRVLLSRAQADAKYPDVNLPKRPQGGTA